jgi:hypothetical protein
VAITIDATKGWARPANASEWTELLAGTGIANPDSSWDCGEASGNLADDIGSLTLTANLSPLYAQSATGWAGTGVDATDGTADRFAAAASVGPDPASSSQVWMFTLAIQTEPTVTRHFGGINTISSTQECRLGWSPSAGTNRLRIGVVGVGTIGTLDHPVGDYVVFLRYDRAASIATAYSDLETVVGTYSASVVDGPKGYGSAGSPGGIVVMQIALWHGANAETIDDADVATIRSRIESPPIALTFQPPSVFPSVVRSHSTRSHLQPSFFAPTKIVTPFPELLFVPPVFPSVVRRSAPSKSPLRQSYAAPTFVPPAAPVPAQPPPSVYPSTIPRAKGPGRSATRPAFTGPVDKPFIPASSIGSIPAVYPQRIMRGVRTSHRRPAFFGPERLIANPTILPIGPEGTATFALSVQARSSVTMSWVTDVLPAWSGLEQRRSINRWPRLRFDFQAQLTDAQQRAVLSQLAGSAQSAPIYLLAMPHEDLTIKANAVGTAIVVHSLARCDWAQSGRRVVVVHPNGTTVDGVIQGAAGDTITTTTDLSATAVEGARIMPVHHVHLEPNQTLSRHLTTRGEWQIVALGERPFAVPVMGVGATVNTHDGMPLWDVGIPIEVARRPLRSGAELVDLGGRVTTVGERTQGNWDRPIAIDSSKIADWQWFKAFLDTVRGQQMPFLLPTGSPDLVPIGDASAGTLLVEGPPAMDYVTDWFPSLAHRRLRLLKADNTFAYRTVTGAIDNGNGTQTLTLASSLAGALSRVEFLETCRLEKPEITVSFDGPRFHSMANALVVQR